MRAETHTYKGPHYRRETKGTLRRKKSPPPILQSLWSPEHTRTFSSSSHLLLLFPLPIVPSPVPFSTWQFPLILQEPAHEPPPLRSLSYLSPTAATFSCAGCTLHRVPSSLGAGEVTEI